MNCVGCFMVNEQLPSLNEYINACRCSWQKGATFKKQTETLICWYILQAVNNRKLPKVIDVPCIIDINWHEKTLKRDTDNIQSAQKYILDALQKMKVIKNDNRKYIKQIYHTVIDDERTFVEVKIYQDTEKGE